MKTDSPLILIVEDNPADAVLIAEELSGPVDRGVFRLANAASLAEAQERLRSEDVAAVLLDLSLPDSIGLETFDDMIACAPNTPVVVLTGLDDSELGLRAVRRGAQDYLVKGKIDGVSLERTLHYSVERKRRETEMRQRQSLEVMSQFADGIAHEFNNVLQTVLGHLQALEWPLRDNPALQSELRAAGESVMHGASLTRRLLGVTGRLPEEPALLDANSHIARLADSLRKSFGASTSIRTVLTDGAWPVFADPAQLEMTILNIVNNARDAMLGHGEVTIRTSNLTIGEPNPADLPAGDYVMIEVHDIGDGLTPDEQKHMFDPFYNARSDARLKGLGLNMTQSFVRSSGGHIGVRSERGSGTTVALYLPRAEAEAGATDTGQESQPRPQHAERVLVLEENAELRGAFVKYLWQLGYPTYEAASAADAMALLDDGEDISLVIIDQRGVSGFPGSILARKMRVIEPQLRVLFLANAGGDLQADDEIPADMVATLLKPCRIADMAKQIESLLGQRSTVA